MPNIAVIGAGITGVTTAYALRARGYSVTVFERNPYSAMETSFANGGQISASNAEVWNHPFTLLKGIKSMFDHNAPLLLSLKPSWHKYSWLGEFIAQIPNYRINTLSTVRLAIEARQRLIVLAERERIDFDLEQRGILHVYHNKKDFQHAENVNQILTEGGLDRYAVSRDELRKIEPALTGDYYGGFYTPSDATGDIHKFTQGLAGACERNGVKFLYDATVHSVTHGEAEIAITWSPRISSEEEACPASQETLRFDGVVICAGVASRKFAATLGDRLNIYPVKGYSITVYLDDPTSREAAPWISLLDDTAKIVTSRLGSDRFRVAGTAEFSGFNLDIRADRILPLIAWTRRLFPRASTERVVPWSGLRPMTPNMLPRVGPGRKAGVFYNTGHGHLGWTLSAATAEIVTTAVEAGLPVATPACSAYS
jgi:D-amino-acid dehydrogenase